MPSFNVQLVAPTDENRCAWEDDSTTLNFGDRFVRVGSNTGGGDNTFDSLAGLVFDLSGIPQGATIDSASLRLWNDALAVGFGTPTINVHADADITQDNFDSADRPSQANLTTASGTIANPPTAVDEQWNDIDVKDVLQEIVSDENWPAEGGLIRLILSPDQTGQAYYYRMINAAGSYSDTDNEPTLLGEYTESSASVGLVPFMQQYHS